MLLGRRYRLELDAEQTAYAERVGGICRAVWNAALDQRRIAAQRGAFTSALAIGGRRRSGSQTRGRSAKYSDSDDTSARSSCPSWAGFGFGSAVSWVVRCATSPFNATAATGTSPAASKIIV